jgi:transcriptional regulator with XRE-family HTH domain
MDMRTARRAKDITQAQLAEKSGVDQRTISDIERGANKNPSWETVARIARILEVDPREIFPIADNDAPKAVSA